MKNIKKYLVYGMIGLGLTSLGASKPGKSLDDFNKKNKRINDDFLEFIEEKEIYRSKNFRARIWPDNPTKDIIIKDVSSKKEFYDKFGDGMSGRGDYRFKIKEDKMEYISKDHLRNLEIAKEFTEAKMKIMSEANYGIY